MGKNLYVGNLDYGVNDEALEGLFSNHGTVESAKVIMDRDSGRSKGFGFVEMSTDEEAQAAISALDGQECGGRNIKLNEAKPREDRGDRGDIDDVAAAAFLHAGQQPPGQFTDGGHHDLDKVGVFLPGGDMKAPGDSVASIIDQVVYLHPFLLQALDDPLLAVFVVLAG